MQHLIKHQPSFPLLQVQLAPGELLVAEAGAMVARAANVHTETKLNAGRSAGFFGRCKALLIALVRKMVGGETLFVNHFSAPQGGWVWLAPAMSGSIRHFVLQPGQSLIASSGAYVASHGNIDLKLRFGGLRTLLAKEGAFMLEISGPGEVWLTSYGAIEEVYVDGTYVVDNGHLVAFESSLQFDINTGGAGLLGSITSGEGLVCTFRGRGRLYLQSRSVGSLVSWLTRLLP